MTRISPRLTLVLTLLFPAAGCLTPAGFSDSLTPKVIGGPAEGRVKNLPNHESAEILLNWAVALEQDQKPADAIVQYEKARALDPKLKNLSHKLAVLYDQVGEERKALAEFDQAVKLMPKNADLLNDYGYCHYNRGRWTEAEAKFRLALAVNPNHPRASINLGLALAQQGRNDEAMVAFQKVCRPAEAKANVAFVLAARGKKAEAKAMYQEALKMEPSLTVARQGLQMLDRPPAKPAVIQAKAESAAPCTTANCPAPKLTPPPELPPVIVDPRAAR